MRKVLFSWHGVPVYSYPAMLYLGLVAGVFSGVWVAQNFGMNADRFAVAMVILLVPALVGARLYFVFTRWDVYRREPRRIWRRSEGGMAMYGGLILAVPLSFPLLRAMDLPFAAFWDAATFTMLLGMAFTRVGCLLNGCCGGRPTATWFALDLPDDRGIWKRRYPTQLIEVAFALLLLTAALALRGRWGEACAYNPLVLPGLLLAALLACKWAVEYARGRRLEVVLPAPWRHALWGAAYAAVLASWAAQGQVASTRVPQS